MLGTPIQPSADVEASGPQTKVILIAGINSAYSGEGVQERFSHLHPLLTQENGFQDSDILYFSYDLVNPCPAADCRSGTWKGQTWSPRPYDSDDTCQPIEKQVGALKNMILDYRIANPESNTTFHVVGHSLGGYIAFLNLANVSPGNISPGTIRQVITVDSPLEGIVKLPQQHVQTLIDEFSECGIGTPAVHEILKRTDASGIRVANRNLVEGAAAQDSLMKVLTLANTNDCLYNPRPCVKWYQRWFVPKQWQRQLVSSTHSRIKARWVSLQGADTQGHGSFLSTFQLARQFIAREIGPAGKASGTAAGFVYDADGTYNMLWTLVEGTDCYDQLPEPACTGQQDGTVLPGLYIDCIASVKDPGGALPHAVQQDLYCYTNSPVLQINPEGYPGCNGDGIAGLPPPGVVEESSCTQAIWGDVSTIKHTQLSGTLTDKTLVTTGCLKDDDAQGSLGHVVVSATQDPYGGLGTVDIFVNQSLAACTAAEGGTIPGGAPDFDDAILQAARQSNDLLRDTDGDGCSDAEELAKTNDAALGGLRDPYNRWDFYDVDGDKVIGLFGDIFPVAFDFGTAGSDATDRAAPIAGANVWNLPGPDGLVTLFDDIFGVAFQFGHDCSA